MLAKLGFKSMSFRDRTRMEARFPRNIHNTKNGFQMGNIMIIENISEL